MNPLKKVWTAVAGSVPKKTVTVYPPLKPCIYLADDREWDKWLEDLSKHPAIKEAYEQSGLTIKALTLDEYLTWTQQDFHRWVLHGRRFHSARLLDMRVLPLLLPEEVYMIINNSTIGEWRDKLPERGAYATPLPKNGHWVDSYTIRLFLIAEHFKAQGVKLGMEMWPPLSDEELSRLEDRGHLPVFPDSGDYVQWLRQEVSVEIDLYHP